MYISPAGHIHQLAAVIVSHDDPQAVIDQLSSYYRSSPALFGAVEWHVVHNGPGPAPDLDIPERRLAEAFAAVQLHQTANHGYGAAINHVMERSRRPFLMGLNADLLATPRFLDHLSGVISDWRRRLHAGERWGIMGIQLQNPDGSAQGSMGRFPNLYRMLMGQLWPRARRKYVAIGSQTPAASPWVTGACILLARPMLDHIGRFDEQFFMYYEDVDLCKRAWEAGWQVRYEPRLVLRHLRPYHARSLTIPMVFSARRAALRYFLKHRPAWEFRALGWAIGFEAWCQRRNHEWAQVGAMAQQLVEDQQDRSIQSPQPSRFPLPQVSRWSAVKSR